MSTITKTPGGSIEAAIRSSNGSARVGQRYLSPIERVITVDGKRLISQDIRKWKLAIDAARSNTTPRRERLYELYDNIILDGHLESVIEKFLSKVLNKKVLFTPKHGFEGMDTQALDEWVIDTPWFRDIIRYRMQSVIWGHSLVELVPEAGVIDRVTLIDRRNVVPERAFMAYSYYNLEGDGIYYLDDAKWSKYMLDFGERLNYGKLMTAAQYVIYKRGDVGDWAQFNELFGMPFREFRYNPYNPGDREKLEQAAKETGGAGYVVLPDGSSVAFHNNNNGTGHETYEKLAAYCNAELSKLFLGNTLTTEQGDNGARSLGEVHGDEQTELMLTHIIETEHDLNWTVKDKLRDLGYPDLDKGNFRFNMGTEMPLDKRILIDIQVSSRIPIPDEYWYETYGIPRPDAATAAKDVKPEPPTQDPDPEGQEKGGQAPTPKPALKVTASITAKCCGGLHDAIAADVPRIAAVYVPDEDEERLMAQLFDGVAGKYDLPTFQANARKLIDGAMSGLAPSYDYDAPDTEAALGFQMNIQRFAFQKNLAQTIELNRVMKASGSYEEFRQQAAVILGTFNDAYLRAEFNLARTVGQTTRDWLNIQANAEVMPYVRYKTVGDANVRPAHASLDNRVFSLADRSFAQFNPPNGYGCRCWLEPVSSPGRDRVTTGEEGENLMGVEYSKMKAGGFAINRADTKAIFNLAEDYAQVLQGADTSIDNLSWADAKRESFTVARGRIGQAMPEERLTATEEMQWGKFPVRGSETMSRAAIEAITKPTEVYMTSDSLRFVRMYSDQMAVAIVDYTDGKLNYRSELFSADDSVRKGLLIQ